MVFYFTGRDPRYLMYMGRDKVENEELIRWGWPEDVWFHVDKHSSAHVYIRLLEGQTIEDVPEEVIEDCAQLTKLNSIEGCKLNDVQIVYTMWSNLKKTGDMAVGQVGFHRPKEVQRVKVHRRINEIVNRLEKSKREENPNFQALREERDQAEAASRRKQQQAQRLVEKARRQEIEREQEIRSYKDVFDEDRMQSNTDMLDKLKLQGKSEIEAARDLEDDFM